MNYYKSLDDAQLAKELSELEERLAFFKSQNLQLNMARGKPSPEQVDLSNELFDALHADSDFIDEGVDVKNYGALKGSPSALKLFSEMLEVDEDELIILGNSSLVFEYDVLVRGLIFGVLGEAPQIEDTKRAFLCPSPGYDRHFIMSDQLGFELIEVEMTDFGPNMDQVEEFVKDPHVKGIWINPKYHNPTGISFSDEVMLRLAQLKPAAQDFRIYNDNAYIEHHLYPDDQDHVLNLYQEAKKYGNEDMVYTFASTSKMTIPGAGVGAFSASPKNIQAQIDLIKSYTINFDKVNQLRHARFFSDLKGLRAHMMKQAKVLRPKFELTEAIFNEEFAQTDLAHWTKPKGGYFVSLFLHEPFAAELVAMAKEYGVVLTAAGSSYPHAKDSHNSHVRICPSYPKLEELEVALRVVSCVYKYLVARKVLQNRES
ncbi:MAG: aminotransferase class I/II-fold pyridoxal phosphate-dependent enzyme [Coriobacteriia bacterium]|nr:aminotransferase class I/II-fold pyridoxal phosphate-dependent enzyme [Coriobacteriia bacterium]